MTTYAPINGNLLDALSAFAITATGWGGIEFVYFIVLVVVMVVLLKFVADIR